MVEQGEPHKTPAELVQEILDADPQPVAPPVDRLHLRWNVPDGRPAFIPLWLSLTIIGLFAGSIIWVFVR